MQDGRGGVRARAFLKDDTASRGSAARLSRLEQRREGRVETIASTRECSRIRECTRLDGSIIVWLQKYTTVDSIRFSRLLRLSERIRDLFVPVDGTQHDETRPAKNGETQIPRLRRTERFSRRRIYEKGMESPVRASADGRAARAHL